MSSEVRDAGGTSARLLVRLLAAAVCRIPPRLGYSLAGALGGAHFLCFPARRRAALANLASILPDQPPAARRRIARRMMSSYNCMLFEFFRLPALARGELLHEIEVIGAEHVRAVAARGRGVIVTSSHIGNWELGAVVLAHAGYQVHAVAGVQLGRWLSPAVRDAKRELAVQTVAPSDGFRKLFRILARNEVVALMVDGDIFSGGTRMPFLGGVAAWPSGPGELAVRTGASVVCGYCERVAPGRFRVVLEPPLAPERFAGADALNARIAEITDRHIREHLDQWCIFRPLHVAAAAAAALPAGAIMDRSRSIRPPITAGVGE
ncbi:MAG TPA: lysophospholipid acyltransferase family protein [Gemmatimonadaceae bacterium]|nr:lysophospholipid acyltransferase family protein [Gemmatimonadaceae bacterium]